MARIDELRAALQNPNVQRFLGLIEAAEGVKHGYNTGFGNTVLESLDDHPREAKTFTETTGRKNVTTAAGRYQFLASTWDDVAGKLGLKDFGPESQDLAAVELLKRAGALGPLLEGDFDTAVAKSGKTWVSLPSGTAPQKKRSDEFVANYLGTAPEGARPATVQAMTAPPAWLAPVLAAQQGTAPGGAGVVPPLRDAVPATQPNAVGALMNALTPQVQPLKEQTSAQVDVGFTPEEDQQLAEALTADVTEARGQALARFTGEDYTPEIPLPQPIDTAINRYLALL